MNNMSSRAVKRYNETIEKAEAKYRKIREKLDKEYHAAVEPVREKYRAIERKASKVYDRVRDPAWKRYEETLEPSKTLLKQVQKAADDIRMKKLRKAAREKTKVRSEAMNKMYSSRAG